MKMNKIILSAALLFVAATSIAQENQLLNVDLGSGLHTLQGKASDGDHGPQMGVTFNLGYRYFIDDNWGIGTGIGFSTYGAKTTFNFIERSTAFDAEVSDEGEEFELRTTYTNFVEKQKVTQLEIPIMGLYQIPNISRGMNFIGGVGLKIGIPVVTKYKLKEGSYETQGYYPSTGEVYASMANHGFSATELNKQIKPADCKSFSLALYGEAGLSYQISNGMFVYGGAYFGYSLISIANKSNKPLVSHDGTYNGSLASNQSNHANPLQFGVKASLLVNFDRLHQMLHVKSVRKF